MLMIDSGSPLEIKGSITGKIGLVVNGKLSPNNPLIYASSMALDNFVYNGANWFLAQDRNTYEICIMDQLNIYSGLTKVEQKAVEHIDTVSPVPVKKDLSFEISFEKGTLVYGTMQKNDATHNAAYISTSETPDAGWLLDGTLPNGGIKVELTANGNTWNGKADNLDIDPNTCM